MNTRDNIQMIMQKILAAKEGGIIHETIIPSVVPNHAPHEFLFFIKPEITLLEKQDQLKAVLAMMFGKFEDYQLHVNVVMLLSAEYLEKFDIIARHYGVINTMSRHPREYFSSEATEKFREYYGRDPDEVDVTGSIEFLHRFPEYDPWSLDLLWQRQTTQKLAGGTYCAKTEISGKDIYLINGFHPKQLLHFTGKGRSIVVMSLSGSLPWSVARNDFIGKTNPAEASSGSLRNEIMKHAVEFGLPAVSSSLNGFHLSAGPLEALTELIRYCSDFSENNIRTPGDFEFGRQLLEHFTPDKISQMCLNPVVTYHQKKISLFDLTEELDAIDALRVLSESE